MRKLIYTLTSFVGLAAFMSAIWVGCGAFLKNNDAYERGLDTALTDPTVSELLGAPVRESWFINGAVESAGGHSQGSWSTRLRGTERSGTLTIVGVKQGGAWGVIRMGLSVGGESYSYQPGRGFIRDAVDEAPDFDILSNRGAAPASWRPGWPAQEHGA